MIGEIEMVKKKFNWTLTENLKFIVYIIYRVLYIFIYKVIVIHSFLFFLSNSAQLFIMAPLFSLFLKSALGMSISTLLSITEISADAVVYFTNIIILIVVI